MSTARLSATTTYSVRQVRNGDLSSSVLSTFLSGMRLLSCGQKIGKQSKSPGHARRQLAKERKPCVNVDAFALVRDQESPRQRGLTRIAHGKDCLVMRIPRRGKVEPSL